MGRDGDGSGFLFHLSVGSLQRIDPFATVVVGDRDAVDPGGHELAQPALGCHLLISAVGLVPVGVSEEAGE